MPPPLTLQSDRQSRALSSAKGVSPTGRHVGLGDSSTKRRTALPKCTKPHQPAVIKHVEPVFYYLEKEESYQSEGRPRPGRAPCPDHSLRGGARRDGPDSAELKTGTCPIGRPGLARRAATHRARSSGPTKSHRRSHGSSHRWFGGRLRSWPRSGRSIQQAPSRVIPPERGSLEPIAAPC
jgi:hypothetical protein